MAESIDHGERSDHRRSFAGLLRDRVFGTYFVGRLFAAAGIWIHAIVSALLAYELTESAFAVGLVSALQFTPQLLFGPLSGAMADRWNRQRQVVVGRSVSACASGGLAIVLAIAGTDDLGGIWAVYCGSALLGIGSAISGPAGQALLPSLVRDSEIGFAVALDSVPFTLARAFAPLLGVFVSSTAGPEVAYGIAFLGNAGFAVLVFLLPIDEARRRSVRGAARGKDATVRAGLRFVRGRPPIMRILIGVVAVGVGTDPAITLAPPLSASMGRGTDLVGGFASAFGIGAALSFATIQWAHDRYRLGTLSMTGLCLMASGTLVAASVPRPALAIVAFAVSGSGLTLALTSFTTLLHERSPEDMRGRILALWGLAFLGSRPLAAALDGAVADVFGVSSALVVNALLVLGCAYASSSSTRADAAS